MFTPSPRSLAPLLAAAALPFTPALAQEISTPSVQVPPAAAAPAPSPPAASATTFAAPKAVVQAAPPPGPQPEDLARQAQTDAAARQSVRRAPIRTVAAPARVAPAKAGAATNARTSTPAAPASTGATTVPATAPAPVATPLVAAPAPETPAATQQTTTTTQTGFNWIWPALGVAALAVIAALLFFRRRRDEEVVYDEPVYVDEPVYASAPVAVAEPLPVVTETVTADRPQIELGIRPIRAGADNGLARVDYELVVENAGTVDAHDVTVTSWLLDGESSDAEAEIIENHVDIAAGEVANVAGTASVDTDRLAFTPVVAADARYTLPDGSEGHIAARFAVGVDGGEPGRITPIVLDRDELREDLGARLEGEVERV